MLPYMVNRKRASSPAWSSSDIHTIVSPNSNTESSSFQSLSNSLNEPSRHLLVQSGGSTRRKRSV